MKFFHTILPAIFLLTPFCALAQAPAPRPVMRQVAIPSYLGVYGMEVDDEIAKTLNLKEARGVLVTKVEPNSPAMRAGLQERDVIVDYNGQIVQSTADFIHLVSETPVGRKVALGVYRAGQSRTLNAVAGTRPTAPIFNYLRDLSGDTMPPAPPSPPDLHGPDMMMTMPDIPMGLMSWQSSSIGYLAEPVDGQFAGYFGVKEGILIRAVTPKSPADKAGLKSGDVIIKADGMPVSSPREVTGMLRRQASQRHVSLTVVRAHKELTLDLIAKNEVLSDSVTM